MTKAQLLAVGSTAGLERGGEQGLLTFEFPKHLQHPTGRVILIAAYLLEYWAIKGVIPRYDGVIDGLRDGAADIFKVAKPVRSNAKGQRGAEGASAAPTGCASNDGSER